MARVKTNDIQLSYAIEDPDGAFGDLPASPVWKQLEPNDIKTFGPEIKTVARYPISKNRQRRKGTTTDLDSEVEFEADLTIDSFVDFIEGFVFAQAAGAPTLNVTSVTAAGDKFNLDDGDAIPSNVLTGSLIFTRGFNTVANNGLNVVTSTGAGASASKVLTIDAANAVEDETVTIDAIVYRFRASGNVAQAYDVLIGADNDATVANLVDAINGDGTPTDTGTSIYWATGTIPHTTVDAGAETGDGTTDITAKVVGTGGNAIAISETLTNGSWAGGATALSGGTMAFVAATGATTVDETVAAGQLATLEVAGYRTASGDLDMNASGYLTTTTLDMTTLGLEAGQFIYIGQTDHAFLTAANAGFARIVSVAANLMTLDKRATTFVTEANAAETIDIFFGRFIRNVTVDDADYVEKRFQFEGAYPNLAGVGSDSYEYSVGNYCDEVELELPLADKATCTFNFIGTDSEPPTTVRKTNAADAFGPEMTTAFNTTSDIARLRITEVDETGLTTDFKDITLNLKNNVSPEKVLGILGAKYMNTGTFEVSIETSCLFTDGDVIAAIRNNDTVTMEFILQNDDGAIVIDIPSMTLGDGSREFPVNETVLVNLEGMAFVDTVLNTSLGVSIFPYLPE